MLIFLVVLIVVSLYEMRFVKFNENYCDKFTTNSIRGICAVLILFSHVKQYVMIDSYSDILYFKCLGVLGQTVVAMFFFYSGYGIEESAKSKQDYWKGFLSKRVARTLIKFDVAVFLYLIMNRVFSIEYSVTDIVLCWVGYKNIGNSSYFIFDILVLYILTYFASRICKDTNKRIHTITVATVLFAIVLAIIKGNQTYWYDTVLCFVVGMYVSKYKLQIQNKLWNFKNAIIAFAALISLFVPTYVLGYLGFGIFEISAMIIFPLIVVVICTRVHIGNKFLNWLGGRAFSIFILQRIPMIVMKQLDLEVSNGMFLLISVIVTLLLAHGFDMLYNKFEAIILHNYEK